jgi:ABC-type branched-subunit amino acid transport system substrate-binding protein
MGAGLLAAAVLTVVPGGTAGEESLRRVNGESPQADGQAPFKQAGEAPLEYRGPGREAPEPDVEEVVLGWFGPGDPDHPTGGDFWRGATLALEVVNREGGYRGRPFRLHPGWSEDPWGTGVVEVTRMVYEHGAWAIVGAIDGAATHLAEQVALKARITLVSSGSTDKTANLASVPWMFSCLPSDEVQAPVLAQAVADVAGDGRFVVVAATDHDSHAALVELRRALAVRGLTPSTLVEFDPVRQDLGALGGRLLEIDPRAVVVLAPPEAGARLVTEVRGRGFAGGLIGGGALALASFGRAAGEAAEGLRVPLLRERSDRWDTFVRMYDNRWGEPPDHGAAQSYDAVRLVVEATRRAGLNRARIRDAVRDIAPWRGVAGIVRWDALGRNERPVGLATWTGGRLQPIAAPDSRER